MSEIIDVHGKVKFIHAVNLSKFDKWTITIYPDPKSLEVIRDLQADGLKNQLKKDDDGYYTSFHREPNKKIRGVVKAFAAPRVLDKDGKTLMDGMKIGWGSDVTVRLEVYKSSPTSLYKYIAARWDSLRVNNLVPFEIDRDMPPAEAEAMKSLLNAEEPEPW